MKAVYDRKAKESWLFDIQVDKSRELIEMSDKVVEHQPLILVYKRKINF
jgi:hypothetical protein